jgi:hypothetical protein
VLALVAARVWGIAGRALAAELRQLGRLYIRLGPGHRGLAALVGRIYDAAWWAEGRLP